MASLPQVTGCVLCNNPRTSPCCLYINLWVDVGLVSGAIGTVVDICYQSGGPPDLPLAVMVKSDCYPGPTLPNGTVPIVPLHHTWYTSGVQNSRMQLPLQLAWAVTIHKAQGLTLNKVVINIGKKELFWIDICRMFSCLPHG